MVSLIISVYKNEANLRCILAALKYQSYKTFEVLVSEDGSSAEIKSAIQSCLSDIRFELRHLTQADLGFRKNRALNTAILEARSERLIFIDGDCVPHPKFIESHMLESERACIATGRRVELGPRYSDRLVKSPSLIKNLGNPWLYTATLPWLLADGIKNPESAYFSRTIHNFAKRRPLSIVGCNFSCSKRALIDINGFNEDYEAPGIGEDSDVEWRFIQAGHSIKNIKFLAPLFHLWHPRTYSLSHKNQEIFFTTKARNEWFTSRGLTTRR